MKKILLLSLILSYGLQAMNKTKPETNNTQNKQIDHILDSGPYQYPTDIDNLIENINPYKVCAILSKLVNTFGPMGIIDEGLTKIGS